MKSFVPLALVVAVSLVPAGCGKRDAPATNPSSMAAPTPAAPTPAAPTPAAPTPAVAAETPPLAVAPTECNFHAIVIGTTTAVPVGAGLADVLAHAGVDKPASEDAAKAALVDAYPFFLKSDDVLAFHATDDGTDATNLYVRKAGGPFVVFSNFHTVLSDGPEGKVTETGNKRYAVVTVTEEYIERVKNCLDDEIDEDDCSTASGDAGMGVFHHVVDRDTMRMAFGVFDGREAEESCDKISPPALDADGKTWSVTMCDGKQASFTLLDLTPCTPEAREKRLTAEAEALDKKAESDKAAREAARRSDSDVASLLNAARKLTSDKLYDDAIAAFDGILATNPEVVRAISGRGYAKMLRAAAGDLDTADADFFKAYNEVVGHDAEDNKLRAQIVFNRALVAEKQDKAERARTFFEKSHELNPTDATRAKLGLP